MKKSIFLPVFAGFIVAAVLGFDQTVPAGWKGTIATENGIKVVHNPGEPLYGEFSFDLQEDLKIGGDPTKEDYYFPRSASLAVDPVGNLYVADMGNRRIMMYDPAGKFIRQIGRSGQGPGEYSYPSRVFIDLDGNPMVYSGRELVCFGKDGTFAKKIPIKIFFSQVVLGPAGTLIGRTQPGRGPEGPKHQLVQVGADGEHFKTIAEFRGEFQASQTAIIIHAYSNFLSFSGLSSDSFVYGFPDEYRLVVADAEGKTILAMTKNEKPRAISSRERAETKENGVYAWIGTNDKTLHDQDFPRPSPLFQLDLHGRRRAYLCCPNPVDPRKGRAVGNRRLFQERILPISDGLAGVPLRDPGRLPLRGPYRRRQRRGFRRPLPDQKLA